MRVSAVFQAKALVDQHAGKDTNDVGLKEMHDLIQEKMRESEAEAVATATSGSGSIIDVGSAVTKSVYVSPYAGLPALHAGEPGALTKEVRGGERSCFLGQAGRQAGGC